MSDIFKTNKNKSEERVKLGEGELQRNCEQEVEENGEKRN